MLGRRWRWLRPLARRYVAAYAGKTRPRHKDVVRFLLQDRGFGRARSKYFDELLVERHVVGFPTMLPVAAARAWDVPAIESIAALAEWLGLEVGELEWFANLKGLGNGCRDSEALRHYNYRVMVKKSGSIRLLESPKRGLKELQRQILDGILDRIPAHTAAHGFIRGRSIKSFAALHVGRRILLRMDMRDFFPSIRRVRVQSLFRTIGYPEAVADLLGGICTNATPRDAWGTLRCDANIRALYSQAHLPQGATSSPALANFCVYRVDCRLRGLALGAGANYTRYADDLAFSGGELFERSIERFSIQVAAILLEEGFALNYRKTRIMRQGVRQHLAGLVVNQDLNVKRDEFDRLKAILTNCARLGPESQNRDAHPFFREHLEGKVGFVEMVRPDKGKRLREVFERIDWSK